MALLDCLSVASGQSPSRLEACLRGKQLTTIDGALPAAMPYRPHEVIGMHEHKLVVVLENDLLHG